MSLKKFTSIQNVGRFHNASAAGDVEFRKLTLIYGENGRGKTTLCAILRSLQSGEAGHINGRRTLGSAGNPSVKILLDAPTPLTAFQGGAWNQTLPALAIFDQQFVSENVYLGDGVGTEQKRNLYKVIVGQDAVGKAQRMDQLVADIRKSASSIRDATKAVESHLVPGLKVQEFVDAEPDPEIDAKIKTLEGDILDASATVILAKSTPFGVIALPPKPVGIADQLAATIESVSSSVEQQLRDHIARHKMGAGGQAWLAQGLEYSPDAGCPWCGQDLPPSGIVNAYRVIFSEAYRLLKDRVTAQGKAIAAEFDALKVNFALQPLGDRQKSIELWKPLCDFVAPEAPTEEDAQRIVANYREQLLRIFRLKHQAPLEPITLDDEARMAEEAFDELARSIASYNAKAEAANATIQVRQSQLQAMNVGGAKAELEKLKALKKRHEPQLSTLCGRLAALLETKTNQETERDAIKADLDAHSSDVVERYQDAINRYLDLFNAGFLIAKVDHNYVGGVNASYHLVINRVLVPLGDERTPMDRPSFKNTLSAGDKSTLALALFLAQLENDPARSQRVVVFDDPFNSQDSFRRNQTAIEIVRVIPRVAQVVVLSHDARFLK
ncbi:MAG: AAA family ATPase, partial [Pseudomonadota bacterium]